MPQALTFADANAFQRGVRRFASSGPGSLIFHAVAHRIDRPVFRLSGGRRTFASMVSGIPVVMLTTTGAKSGKQRTVPVLGVPFEGTVAVIASNFGQKRQPGWYYNLRSNPEGEMSVESQRRRFRAVEATGEQRARIWDEALKVYPGFTTYEKRASHRDIHVFVLQSV